MSRKSRHLSFDDNAEIWPEIPHNNQSQRSEVDHKITTLSDVSGFGNYDGMAKSGELDFMTKTNKAGRSNSTGIEMRVRVEQRPTSLVQKEKFQEKISQIENWLESIKISKRKPRKPRPKCWKCGVIGHRKHNCI